MGFLLDFFGYELKKGYEDPATRRQQFEERLAAAQQTQTEERKLASMNARPKYRYEHLQFNPFYEQRNRMFPHRRLERRPQQ